MCLFYVCFIQGVVHPLGFIVETKILQGIVALISCDLAPSRANINKVSDNFIRIE